MGFRDIDQNGSGQISLAELDLGIKVFLHEDCFLMKPAIKEAFKYAKDSNPNDKHDDPFVEFHEFRILMVALRMYIELYCAFDEVDTGDDNRVDFEEFKVALPMFEKWGVKIEVPEAAFAEIDEKGGGQVLFNEFAQWALHKGLDFDDSLEGGDLSKADIKVPEKKKVAPKK